MEKSNKTLKNSENAITLIALVITVIVLLILAGISIAMLSGDNSILQRATDAKTQSDEAQIKERIQLAYHSALTKDITGENGELTKPTLQEELNNEFKDKTATITPSADNKEWVIKVDNVEVSVVAGKDDEQKQMTVAQAKSTGTIFETNTTLVDDYRNEVKVPKGFGIAVDSGTKVEDGIVIEDADATNHPDTVGSQFVWIPVGEITKSDATTATISLRRYVFGEDGTIDTSLSQTEPSGQLKTSSSSSYYCTEGLKDETTSNTHAKDIAGFISSANTNKGYYIARYEASQSNGKVASKVNQNVWNNITQQTAAIKCQGMYPAPDVTSDLINSYAWDTGILFIQTCGTKSAKYSRKRRLQSSLTTTGNASDGTNKDVKCNIYDMAGNVNEWATETRSVADKPCVYRGGYYNGTYTYTAYRNSASTGFADKSIGFRPILYF